MAGSALSRSTVASTSASLDAAGSRIVTECMPASSHALPLAAHVDLARGILAHQHDRQPGFHPRSGQPGHLLRHLRPDDLAQRLAVENRRASSGELHGAGLPDDHDLDLPRVLQLVLDASARSDPTEWPRRPRR